MRLLIDMDVVAYRAAFAAEKTLYLVNGQEYPDAKAAKEAGAPVWSRKDTQPVDQAILIADVMLRDIHDHYKTESAFCVGFLTGIGNYRHGIATRASYKGGRSQPPTHLRAVREHLIARGGTVVSVGEEADDLIGIAMTEFPDSVVCSIDKDLMQLPGRHYNFVSKEEVTVSKKEAVLNLYTQVIAGDSVDNVPGCRGMGPVKARKALEGCKNPYECWRTALDIYGAEYGEDGYGFALETAALVYVRRKPGEFFVPPASNGMSTGDVSGKAEKTEAQQDTKAGRGRRVSKRIGAGDSGATDSVGGAV